MTRLIVVATSLVIAATACGQDRPPRALEAGRLGHVRVLEPTSGGAAFVFVFSDASGWTPALDAAAHRVARDGAAVVEVELPRYLRGLAASSDGCHYVVAELEELSHRLQRELGYPSYRSPVVAGLGAGGTLAYAALAQSPAATLAGAVSVDPAAALATRVPLCPGAPSRAAAGGGFSYGATDDLPGFWRVSSTSPLPADLGALAAKARDTFAPAQPDPGEPPERRLVSLLGQGSSAAPAGRTLADLPLHEIPVPGGAARLAVIYSGDGGWRDLDKQIGDYLAAHGTPVVGVDSLRYFWRAKTPEQVAHDLSRILHRYRERWGAEAVLLVGYSFGAGILPFAVNRLPADDRATIVQISLLGLGQRAPFEFRVTGWLGGHEGAERPVLPEVTRLDLSRVQCVYGEEEKETLCPDPALASAEIIRTAGSHHFDGDYRALARRILEGAARRGAAPERPAQAG